MKISNFVQLQQTIEKGRGGESDWEGGRGEPPADFVRWDGRCSLSPSLSCCHSKTTHKRANFETLEPFCFLVLTGMRKDFHYNA